MIQHMYLVGQTLHTTLGVRKNARHRRYILPLRRNDDTILATVASMRYDTTTDTAAATTTVTKPNVQYNGDGMRSAEVTARYTRLRSGQQPATLTAGESLGIGNTA
jgi:hypothetical protein